MPEAFNSVLMKSILVCLLLAFAVTVHANPALFKHEVKADFKKVYNGVKKSLEEKKFWIIFEAHISDNLARFKNKWGAEYNKNKLNTIRSLMVCNIYHVNQVANLDPDMAAFCPLRIVIVEKKPKVRVLFIKPSVVAGKSKAVPALKAAEAIVIKAIQEGAR